MSDKPRPAGGIMRGLAETGPAVWSYGFRPFFLGAAVWAALAMLLWLAVLSGVFSFAETYGPAAWHAHEMLFGFGPAVLTGYLMTAVPNWTGRFPLSGPPLARLFALWCAGRAALLMVDWLGPLAITVDAAFLPVVLFICAREILAGRKWRDLRLVAVLAALTLANGGFHAAVLSGADETIAARLALSLYVMLIAMVGGRMVPSFTWNYIRQKSAAALPAAFGPLDRLAVMVSLPALAGWVFWPEERLTAALAFAAVCAHGLRLGRWRGWLVLREPLILAMHAAYAFVALGFAAIGLGALGFLPASSVVHVLTVGAMAGMMLAVMMRATRGHTGRATAGSALSGLASALVCAAALLRPAAGLWPEQAGLLHMASGLCWMAAFGLFLVEYGPLLLFVRRKPR